MRALALGAFLRFKIREIKSAVFHLGLAFEIQLLEILFAVLSALPLFLRRVFVLHRVYIDERGQFDSLVSGAEALPLPVSLSVVHRRGVRGQLVLWLGALALLAFAAAALFAVVMLDLVRLLYLISAPSRSSKTSSAASRT